MHDIPQGLTAQFPNLRGKLGKNPPSEGEIDRYNAIFHRLRTFEILQQTRVRHFQWKTTTEYELSKESRTGCIKGELHANKKMSETKGK